MEYQVIILAKIKAEIGLGVGVIFKAVVLAEYNSKP